MEDEKRMRKWLKSLVDKYGDARLVDVEKMERTRMEKEKSEQKQREQ